MNRVGLPIGAEVVWDESFPPELGAALRDHFAPYGEPDLPEFVRYRLRVGRVAPGGEPVVEEAGIRVTLRGGRLVLDAGHSAAELDGDGRGATIDLRGGGAASFVARLADPLVSELARADGWLAVHAAAIAPSGRAILLAGPGGSGKSTLFRQAVAAGIPALSDDLVFVGCLGEIPLAVPFPRGAPYDPIAPPTAASAPLAAIVFPEIGAASESRIEPLGPDDALPRLAREARALAPERAAEHFRALVALVSAAPAYRFVASRGGADALGVLSGLEKSHAA